MGKCPLAQTARRSFDDLYGTGRFIRTDTTIDASPGAFFTRGVEGTNEFVVAGTDYTDRANAAWAILQTG